MKNDSTSFFENNHFANSYVYDISISVSYTHLVLISSTTESSLPQLHPQTVPALLPRRGARRDNPDRR